MLDFQIKNTAGDDDEPTLGEEGAEAGNEPTEGIFEEGGKGAGEEEGGEGDEEKY